MHCAGCKKDALEEQKPPVPWQLAAELAAKQATQLCQHNGPLPAAEPAKSTRCPPAYPKPCRTAQNTALSYLKEPGIYHSNQAQPSPSHPCLDLGSLSSLFPISEPSLTKASRLSLYSFGLHTRNGSSPRRQDNLQTPASFLVHVSKMGLFHGDHLPGV